MVASDIPLEKILQQTVERYWETVPPTWNRIRSHVRATATEEFDISIEQFHILRHMRKGVISVSDLAEARQISRPAVSQAINALVEKGLVARQQSKDDRRFVQLELTPAGTEMINTIFGTTRAWMMEKMANFSMEEIETLMKAMEILKKTFDETGA